jgi:O-antigen/teichoic acid export membrane protein
MVLKNFTKLSGLVSSKHSKNSLWNVFELLVPPAFLLLISPLCIEHLGDEEFGVWMLLYSFIGLFGALNFGLSDTAVKFIAAKYHGEADVSTINFLTTIITVFAALAVLLATFFYFFSSYLVNDVFEFQPIFVARAELLLQIGGGWVGLKLFENGLSSILKGAQRFDVSGRISLIENITVLIFALIAQQFGFGLNVILVFAIISVCLGITAFATEIKRIFSIRGSIFGFEFSELKPAASFSFWAWVQGTSGSIFNQTDKILVASIISVSNVAIYVVCLQVAQLIQALIAAATAFLFPVASNLVALNKNQNIGAIFHQVLAVVIPIVIAMTAFLYLSAETLLVHFFSEEFAQKGTTLLQLQVLVFSGTALTAGPYYLMNGAGLIKINVLFASASAILILLLSPMMIEKYGLIGGGYARLFNFFVVSAYFIYTKIKLLPTYPWASMARLWASYLVPLSIICYLGSVLTIGTNSLKDLFPCAVLGLAMFVLSILINGRRSYTITERLNLSP